jgi:hypothetical protein
MGGEDTSDSRVLPMLRKLGGGTRKSDPLGKPEPAPAPAPAPSPPRRGYLPDVADTAPPPKKSDPLPKPGDPYQAHARFLNRLPSEPRLIHFVRGDFAYEGFCYSDLRRLRWLPAAAPGQGPVLLLRFIEAVTTDVALEGRRIEDVHYWISEGVMSWVWEKPPGFEVRDDAATVITRITIIQAKGPVPGE